MLKTIPTTLGRTQRCVVRSTNMCRYGQMVSGIDYEKLNEGIDSQVF
ncbi:unnamed protein product [Haemonchus placei]|uniref:Uncharacterized protein n=1 Tax=Haemonchus placei TaxID=6290 RepID=A0A3P7YLY5_HAEPC|nr:unnamed protein product [Haemonchus placei]